MNIFAQQAQIDMANLDPDKEKPRASLYNVVKRLRENNVSSPVPICKAFALPLSLSIVKRQILKLTRIFVSGGLLTRGPRGQNQ
jgi:hypothetical protein